jgi:UDP-N-acetylmuramyl pentapeptide phosphotransferase/UDP-N-acetylglucosamine-1-phosphate transferase
VIWVVAIVIGGVVVAAATLLLRTRMARPARLALLVAGALAVGIGAIGLQDDATALEWVLTPLVLAALALLHDRLVFAGDGPRRI